MGNSTGKRVADDLYLHVSALSACLNAAQLELVHKSLQRISTDLAVNVLKVNERTKKMSWLAYEDFDRCPFPRLLASWTFDMAPESPPTERSYQSSLNPPILHRKELLVVPDYPGRSGWVELTKTAEELGLFENSNAIGFRLNWERIIETKGYHLDGDRFIPIGNTSIFKSEMEPPQGEAKIQRHLTALSRSALSAPVQLLLRHVLLKEGVTFFDYGCGRGNDIATLRQLGLEAGGWDPHFAKDQLRSEADVVNLGFVINVIEDPAERVEALHQAFRLANRVLSIGVMLQSYDSNGLPFNDGVLTSRSTFQKYFTQGEIKCYVEDVLQTEAFMVGPGVAFVFSDKTWQQAFEASRYRSTGVARRLRITHTRVVRERSVRASSHTTVSQRQLEQNRTLLDSLWSKSLDLGRYPEAEEVESLSDIVSTLGTYRRALRLLTTYYDQSEMAVSRDTRMADLSVYFAIQQFSKRRQYRNLESGIQRDVKAFFGDYGSAQTIGVRLLRECANQEALAVACSVAASQGLGWLEHGHSLQLHVSLIERLPAVLRVYVACGLVLWDSLSDIQLLKIHITSGKLTLMEFDNFDTSPMPSLRKRVKVNVRKLDYSLFEYGSTEFPKPLLYFKSRYINEEYPGFAEQLEFDEDLMRSGCISSEAFGPQESELHAALAQKRLEIIGMQLLPSRRFPHIDEMCGANFPYRALIECGETQATLQIQNSPKNVQTYNALYALATQILDPVVDYFGAIRLTYGLCTSELGKHIKKRVAHDLDQHAACELKRNGRFICERLGAACDFIVDDEDMLEVAKWIMENLPFDRLYYYGPTSPLHVSFGPDNSRTGIQMIANINGVRLPRPLQTT
jgi:DNA phosphorothioation-associated putative methyltransferase